MTAYFDKAHQELSRIQSDKSYIDWLRQGPDPKVFTVENAARDWENRLVDDCTTAVYFPGYADLEPLPDKFKRAVNQTILNYGVYTLPLDTSFELETPDQLWGRLGDLCWHLHTVFHTITLETGRSDNPLACQIYLACQAAA